MRTKTEYRELMAGVGCVLCGNILAKRYGQVIMFGYKNEVIGWLCRQCVSAGPEGAAHRAHKHANELRESADMLDDLAQAVVQCTEWVTLTEAEAIDASVEEARLDAANSPT